jgi:hypothetical protein
LKEEALDRINWRNRFGRGCGPVVWEITDYEYLQNRRAENNKGYTTLTWNWVFLSLLRSNNRHLWQKLCHRWNTQIVPLGFVLETKKFFWRPL